MTLTEIEKWLSYLNCQRCRGSMTNGKIVKAMHHDKRLGTGEVIFECPNCGAMGIWEFRQAEDMTKQTNWQTLMTRTRNTATEKGCVSELAIICKFLALDLDAAIEAKLKYNETREHRHGGKLA